jgi:signal recognition particle GTPase
MNTGDIDKLVNDILKADQLSEVNDIAVAIKAGKLNFLEFIENLR